MLVNDNIVISKQTVKKILLELNNINLICDDNLIKDKVENIISLIKNSSDIDCEVSTLTKIYNKMQEIREVNEELHVRLYMLYRKLQDAKISEDEAQRTYIKLIRNLE
ncbi:hypothetical protein [Clostridium cylindrosporum]|uniref:Uncharacterized protein n=1 Tax=Clostridium cylindrosporum DSM 605 TaxID=1121307 RepID=A0A0J8G4M7_CLOCY|nr:hypothetical protein [Clostridium cylindrosporum]KMT22626.1 hypothetical protein CLCY_9c00570 [Clostridium cylindrosporum DSM 605]